MGNTGAQSSAELQLEAVFFQDCPSQNKRKAEWEGTGFDLRLMIASLVLERMKGGLCDESVTIQQSWAGLLKQLHFLGFPGGSVVKNLPANPGDMGLIPGLRRSCMSWST